MAEVNTDWIKEQLTVNKTKKIVGDSVLKLIETFESLKPTTEQNIKDTVEIFSKLALGYPLVKEDKNEIWEPVQPGFIKVADHVRIKLDAFVGEKGISLNGRRGRVVGIRYGDIVIKTNDGKTPVLDGTHFLPENLEKLVM